MKKKIYWGKLIVSLAIPQLIGFIGSLFTSSSIATWYPTLTKPFFNPPNWLFAPVWTLLFLLMGISVYLVWVKGFKKNNVKLAIIFFDIQLLFNLLWSILFFGLKNPLLALIEIFILWGLILVNIILFYKISKTASYLLIPYLAWVTFAIILNFSFVLLN